MKYIYHIFAALLLAGCAKGEPEQPQGVKEYISFDINDEGQSDVNDNSTEAGLKTRAKEFGYWQGGMSLHVYSWQTNTSTQFREFNLLYNAPYTTSWSYDNPIEQPEVSISYYAYYPENGGVSNFAADGFGGGFDYMVPTYTEDLFISKAISSSARVPMFFFHPLSEVNFAVQGVEGYKITLANIRVNDVKNFGHMTMATWESGTWSGVGGSASYVYSPAGDADGSPVFPTDGLDNDLVYLGNHGGWVPGENDRPNALMLMPQSFDTPATGGYMSFNYIITRTDGTPYKSGDAVQYFADFTQHEWKKAKRYLYIIDCRGLIEAPTTRKIKTTVITTP